MEPQLFGMSDGKCFLIYGNSLVINLPASDVAKCVRVLNRGFMYPDKRVREYLKFQGAWQACYTLKLNDAFKVRYNNDSFEGVIADETKTFRFSHQSYSYKKNHNALFIPDVGFFMDWLADNLKRLGFSVSSRQKAKRWLWIKSRKTYKMTIIQKTTESIKEYNI